MKSTSILAQFQNYQQPSVATKDSNGRASFIIGRDDYSARPTLAKSASGDPEEVKTEGQRKEEDFLFGNVSAAKYQEFNVVKINKRGKKQVRVLGIDGFNIYNIRKKKAKEDPIMGSSFQGSNAVGSVEKKKSSSFIAGFLSKKLLGDKRKERSINSIIEIKKLRDNPLAVEIVFAEKTSNKGIVYECLSVDNQSEIIAKITFIRVNNTYSNYIF